MRYLLLTIVGFAIGYFGAWAICELCQYIFRENKMKHIIAFIVGFVMGYFGTWILLSLL